MLQMDPIDQMALRFSLYLHRIIAVYDELISEVNNVSTIQEAIRKITSSRRVCMVDLSNFPESLYEMHGRYTRCVESLEEIKRMAKAVFIVNFASDDSSFVFNKEVSFSYACKMCSLVSPLRHHFSGPPLMTEIIRGELFLAMKHPLHLSELNLLCLESMPLGVANLMPMTLDSVEKDSRESIAYEDPSLECNEEMPMISGPSSPCLLCKLS